MNKKHLFFLFILLFLSIINTNPVKAQTQPRATEAPLPADQYQIRNYRTDYGDYYNFAKTRLFDNQEFFGLQEEAAPETPGGVDANKDTCGGKYVLSETGTGTNYGDPNCDFDQNKLYDLLKAQDPKYADYWYFTIVPCESSYKPNAYLRASTSGKGAFGLFQMNPKGQGNGEFDAGNVEWRLQTSNAVNYNKLIGESFAYWACR